MAIGSVCLLVLLLASCVSSQRFPAVSEAHEEQLITSSDARRHLQGATDVTYPQDIPRVGLGEDCRIGGNIRPILCNPGLFCDAHRPRPLGLPNRDPLAPHGLGVGPMIPHNPDSAIPGKCKALAPAPAEEPFAPEVVGEGSKCREGGNMVPIVCDVGLYCDIPKPVWKLRSGHIWNGIGPMLINPDIPHTGVCRAISPAPGPSPLGLPVPVQPEVSGEGGPCRKGGSMMPIVCEKGLYCNVRRLPVGSTQGWNRDISTTGVCMRGAGPRTESKAVTDPVNRTP